MQSKPDKKITFDLHSTPDSVKRATGMLSGFFDKLSLPEEGSFDINLAVQEAVVNAAEHGNGYDRGKQVHVSCEVADGRITVVVGDEGPGFNPDSVPDPTLPQNILEEAGRGIFLMRNLCDEIRFNDKGNQVTMIKKLPEQKE